MSPALTSASSRPLLTPHAVSASPAVLSPLPLLPSAALSSASYPVVRYSPPAPSSCTSAGGSPVSLCLPLPVFAFIAFPDALLVVGITPPLLAPPLPPALPPATPFPYPLSCGLLHPPEPPRDPPPPALAADIDRKDEYVGHWTGGVRYADIMRAGLHPMGSALSGPFLW